MIWKKECNMHSSKKEWMTEALRSRGLDTEYKIIQPWIRRGVAVFNVGESLSYSKILTWYQFIYCRYLHDKHGEFSGPSSFQENSSSVPWLHKACKWLEMRETVPAACQGARLPWRLQVLSQFVNGMRLCCGWSTVSPGNPKDFPNWRVTV